MVVTLTLTRSIAGLNWPANHFLPSFSKPAPVLDCVAMRSLSSAQQALFVSLEGIVNRTQPRIACVGSGSEGEFTWLNIHNLPYDVINGFTAIQKYQTNVTGLVVTDPNQPDTLNLATTIAGVKNELICAPSLLPTLTNAPYNLPVKDDLRGMFSNKYQVYGYLYTNYWPLCTHRVIVGLETNCYWHLRDYATAVKAAVVWLDPNVIADANVLKLFTANMTPADGVYLGWVPNENADLKWLATYGIPVMASDFFNNGSVFSGVATAISVPPIPPTPPLQNRIYVSITLSDGDNVQYMQHTMIQNWDSAARGTVPLGWTVQPLLADLDPGMMNYFWSTATTNDCLVAGPSGAGYDHIEYWTSGNIVDFVKASSPYLQSTGIRTVAVCDTVSSATANAFATNCVSLLGLNDQDGGYYTAHYGTLPVIGFPANGNYATNAAELLYAITNTAQSWNGSSPMFIAAQARSWTVTPANCQSVASALDPSRYVVVRPDQLFLLYRVAAGLGPAVAAPYVTTQPISQSASVGTNVTFRVIASGTEPLSYQWQFDGANIVNATNSIYTRTNVQLSDAGNYQVVVANAYSSVISDAATLTFGNQPLGFNGNGLNWTVNQNSGYFVYSPPAAANNLLSLTDGGAGEARSAFFSDLQYIGAFKAAFTYQAGGNKSGDGVTFCLQSDPRGPAALGSGGGGLGVNGIAPSIELELNLYTGNSQNVGYTVLRNGLTGAAGANGNYHVPGNVNLASGDPVDIAVDYANARMGLTFTDRVAHTSFSTNLYVGHLTQILGKNAAYVGFTGADGGATSVQTITNFSFTSILTAAIQLDGTNVLISWPRGAPGYTLQQNSDLTSTNWMNVTNQNVLAEENQVTVPLAGSNCIYRLMLPSMP